MATSPSPPTDWIEIFHSKPSMKRMYLQEKLPDGTFTPPIPSSQLLDASHIRPGFRVFRTPARPLEFVLTNGTDRNWEDNHGANYHVSHPGRYVVEHGIRRVDDANPNECIQAILRTKDEYIQLEFRADLWEKCYCSYQKDDDPWTPAPGVQMLQVNKVGVEGKYFQISVKARKFQCAFNDGGEIWDSNLRNNYKIGHPGKYAVKDGNVVYLEPADSDKNNPVASAQTSLADPLVEPNVVDTPPVPSTNATTKPASTVKVAQLAQ